MAPDIQTVLFKILKYADECLKAEVEPTIEEARRVAGVGNLYFVQVMKEADRKELLTGLYFPQYVDAAEARVFANNLAITIDGADYLKENSAMQKVASTISPAVNAVIENAVNATIKAAMGF